MPVMWYGCVVADLRRAAREALYLEPESGFGVGVIIFDNVQKNNFQNNDTKTQNENHKQSKCRSKNDSRASVNGSNADPPLEHNSIETSNAPGQQPVPPKNIFLKMAFVSWARSARPTTAPNFFPTARRGPSLSSFFFPWFVVLLAVLPFYDPFYFPSGGSFFNPAGGGGGLLFCII